MNTYKEFISTTIEKLIDLGYLKEKPVGEDIKIINKIEKNFKIKLPELYKEFLLQMGFKGATEAIIYHRTNIYIYDYFRCFFDNNQFYHKTVVNKILRKDKSEHYPLRNKLVIGYNERSIFDFIPTDCGDNPPVYHYLENGNSKSLEYLETEEIIEKRVMYEALYGIEISKMFFKDLYYLNGTIHYESFSEYIISLIYNKILRTNRYKYILKRAIQDGDWYTYTNIQNKKEYIEMEEKTKEEFEYISTALRKIIPKNNYK